MSEVLPVRKYDSYNSDVCPLILNRQPGNFTRQVSCFVVPADHALYGDLRELIENWYVDVPAGSSMSINVTSKIDYDETVPKCWYVIDFRKTPDAKKWKNKIELKNWDKLTAFAQARIIFELYEKVKGLVVFADTPDDIPETMWSNCVLGLTNQSTEVLTQIIQKGVFLTPTNAYTLKSSTDYLGGFHRFESMPTYVQWPSQ
jgi:hypothetical protein